MVMDKFTPGPWVYSACVQRNGFDTFSIWTEGSYQIAIGELCPGEKSLPETEANARLIAAAPELLTTMREVLRITDRKHDAWTAAYAAIAKATGQAP